MAVRAIGLIFCGPRADILLSYEGFENNIHSAITAFADAACGIWRPMQIMRKVAKDIQHDHRPGVSI
jgi:hypothetical protein